MRDRWAAHAQEVCIYRHDRSVLGSHRGHNWLEGGVSQPMCGGRGVNRSGTFPAMCGTREERAGSVQPARVQSIEERVARWAGSGIAGQNQICAREGRNGSSGARIGTRWDTRREPDVIPCRGPRPDPRAASIAAGLHVGRRSPCMSAGGWPPLPEENVGPLATWPVTGVRSAKAMLQIGKTAAGAASPSRVSECRDRVVPHVRKGKT